MAYGINTFGNGNLQGFNGIGEDDLRQLLALRLPEEQQSFQAQEPQPLVQGFLGGIDNAGQQQQQQDLNDLIGRTLQRSANIGQIAQAGAAGTTGGGQNARLAQQSMQAALRQEQRQEQQQAQAGQMLGQLAKMFLMA